MKVSHVHPILSLIDDVTSTFFLKTFSKQKYDKITGIIHTQTENGCELFDFVYQVFLPQNS